MSLTRRNFLSGAIAGAAAASTIAGPAEAREAAALPPDALGLLFDSTLCIGCKACVTGCRNANGTKPEFSTEEKYWDTPLDISGYTLTVIKMYSEGTGEAKDQEKNGFAFVKKSCLHCVDPSCVSVCPVSAMKKDPDTGIVSYDPDACIGCRYCVAACPFGVPRFQYDTAVPKISKCELCRHRLSEGKLPGCAEVCPTGATLFGPVSALKAEADRRRALVPGELSTYPRQRVSSSDVHEKPAAKYVPHTYGETEVGGTQMLLLSGVPFDKMGYPDLPKKAFVSTSETIQHTLYKGLIAPAVLFSGLLYFAHKNSNHDDHGEE
jgi:Fe-S-cluster-containing dehydrogenase component